MSKKSSTTLPQASGPLIDIRVQEESESSEENLNTHITEALDALASQIESQNRSESDKKIKNNNRFRIRNIKNASRLLKDYPEKITSGKQAMHLKGIGKGIADRIDEILKTDTLEELSATPVDEESQVVEQLLTVTGIGIETAQRFYRNYGIRSVDQLIKEWQTKKMRVTRHELTHHIAIGLKYYHDFLARIPHDEITEAIPRLEETLKLVDPALQMVVAGSYRRQTPTSGDIDILVTHKKYATYEDLHNSRLNFLHDFVSILTDQGFIIDNLTEDVTTKYMGVCKIRDRARRIDIRMVSHDSWPSAILYFTGSGQFNVRMRNVALSRGYTLNEYGLYPLKQGKKGDPVPVKSEKDIFQVLGIIYVDPVERL